MTKSAAIKGKGAARKPRDMSKLKCYNCQQFGHFKANCTNPKVERDDTDTGKAGKGAPKGQAMVSEQALAFATTCGEDVPAGRDLSTSWILDSGATHHLTNVRGALVNSRLLEEPLTFNLANKSTIQALEVGDIRAKLATGQDITIKDVFYVPESRVSLLSVQRIMDKGWKVQMTSSGGVIRRNQDKLTIQEEWWAVDDPTGITDGGNGLCDAGNSIEDATRRRASAPWTHGRQEVARVGERRAYEIHPRCALERRLQDLRLRCLPVAEGGSIPEGRCIP